VVEERQGHHLAGGLEQDFYDFPFSWECHNPNWMNSIIFQRGGYTTNQSWCHGLVRELFRKGFASAQDGAGCCVLKDPRCWKIYQHVPHEMMMNLGKL